MGGLAERMITESVDALIRRDVALGKRVVASDAEGWVASRPLTVAERERVGFCGWGAVGGGVVG